MYGNLSLTKESMIYLDDLLQNAEKHKVIISKINDAIVIDCGIKTEGSLAAGMLFTKISLGGLANVNLDWSNLNEETPMMIMQVETSYPVLSVLGCQAASWNINKGDFSGMVCGPGRALAQKPSKIFKLLEYKDESEIAILCIESDKLPTEEIVEYLAEKCNVKKQNLRLLMIKTSCLVEYIQMAARAIELGIFRLVEQMNYPKERVLHAVGIGIIPPFSENDEVSNDRVNNGLIYGTRLYLIIKSAPNDNINEIIKQIPSKSSKFYGRKFIDVFNEAGRDFTKFDLSLLAPTEVIINDLRTGNLYQEGKINIKMIVE
ncbi:MAG: methenyltetrahydromethanopterin cyclohydrolase [Candidatus Heimdallarchaeota archaeon]|nr:methenyltetrahydromethanopterin cyclohydrolase [Candidatus Heimdallarchaeota archaeon]